MNVLKAMVALACIACAALNPAVAAYPDRPVRIIVPYPAGGGTDAVTRIIAKKLSETWGKAVVIDNRPGADT